MRRWGVMSKRKGSFKSRKELIENIKYVSRQAVEYILKNNELEKQLEKAYNKIAELEKANRAIEILQSMGLIITDENINSGYQQTMINREIQRRMEE